MRSIPAYCLHKASGQAFVYLPDTCGRRQAHYLGLHNSKESKVEYARVIACYIASPHSAQVNARGGVSISVVLLAFLKHAKTYYAGNPKRIDAFKQVMKPVRVLFGHTPAAEFGPLALKAVREEYGKAVHAKRPITRRGVNRRIVDLRSIFTWAAAEELIPGSVPMNLKTVKGLMKHRCALPESRPIEPIDDATVDATLPHLPPPVAAMVRIQPLTGMRPQEVCRLRGADLDRTGQLWWYRPAAHKTSYAGKLREIPLGPKARAILEPLVPSDPAEFVFTPAKTNALILGCRAAARVTPRYPSHMARNARKRSKNPRRAPSVVHYGAQSYRQCIHRACGRAGVALWQPNQLRHTYATEIRKAAGLDAAQIMLGHASANITQVYAAVDHARAADIATQHG